MADIAGITLGMYLARKKKYKVIIIIHSILVAIALFMFISGVNEKATYERLQAEGVIVTATCYSKEREPLSGEKYNKRSYWEWQYNGKYYGKDVVQTEPEKQLSEIGKTAKVYIDPNEPNNYILETDFYNPNGTMYIGFTIFVVFGSLELITIVSIIVIKRRDKMVGNIKK